MNKYRITLTNSPQFDVPSVLYPNSVLPGIVDSIIDAVGYKIEQFDNVNYKVITFTGGNAVVLKSFNVYEFDDHYKLEIFNDGGWVIIEEYKERVN